MTEQERREKFNEALDLLCQQYAVMQVVTSEDCVVMLQDGSRMRGVRDSIDVVLLPMDSPPPQVDKQAKT